MGQAGRLAFVLMPFTAEFDQVLERVIKPALGSAGFEARRADSVLDQRSVMQDVVEGIANADVVIADLSEPNANVYYELGLAHGLRKKAVLLSQSIDAVPFDLKAYRIVLYSRDFAAVQELADRLVEILEQLDALVFGSPLSDYQPRGADGVLDQDSGDEAAALEPIDLGVIDAMVAIEESGERMLELLEQLGRETESVAEQFNRRGAEIAALEASGKLQPRGARRIATAAAQDLGTYAAQIESLLPSLETQTQTLIDSGMRLTREAASSADVDEEQRRQFLDALTELRLHIIDGREQIVEFQTVLHELRGLTRQLAAAADRSDRALTRVVDTMSQIDAFCVRATELLDEEGQGPGADTPPPSGLAE